MWLCDVVDSECVELKGTGNNQAMHNDQNEHLAVEW